MDSYTAQAKELALAEDGLSPLFVGKSVYDPLLFAPKEIKFTAQQYIFLRTYRLGVPIEDAAAKAGLTKEQAEAFLDRPKTQEWLHDRAIKDYIKHEWEEPGKWWKEGDAVLNGHKDWSKAQIEVWKAFGERIAPVKKERETQSQPKIEINIDPSAVQEAFRRQNAIEAKLVEEQRQ